MYSIYIKGTDKTDLYKVGSLSISKGADNRSSCSLSLLTTAAYCDVIGQDLQVKDGSDVIFGGVIKTASISKLEPGTGSSVKLRLDITSNGYGDIPARRTTTAVFTNKTAGDIVTYMVNEVLNYAGANDQIGTGTINDGATLAEYAAVCKTVKDILDELADASGYKWYIDDNRDLHFVEEDTVTDAAHDIAEGGAFTDYELESLESSLDNYRNKQFVKGGAGEDGNNIQIVVEDSTEISARQTSEGSDYSSGIYGNVIDDSNITNETTATNAAENALKKYGVAPATLTFTSFTNDWVSGTKLKVNLPTFGISSDEYYLIEEVSIRDTDGVNLQSTVTATRRKSSDFSTQRSENYIDYFSKLVKKSSSGTTVSGSADVAPFAATATNAASVSVTTSEVTAATLDLTLTSRSRIVISFSCEITISGGAANLTALTYIDAVTQTYQPTLYCASEQTYVLSYVDYKDAMASGDYTVAVKLLTDANGGNISIGHARLVVQVYPQAVPYLANPTGFTATVNGSSEIDLAWTNPTASTFTEVKLYQYSSSLEAHDRAWCETNATLIYNNTGTSYNDTGLSAETAYYYKLFAVHTVDGTDYYSVGITQSGTTEEYVGLSYPGSLIHFNGENDSTTFTDVSTKAWTAVGTAKLSTAQKKFGTASFLSNSSSSYIYTPSNEDYEFSSGDFSIDFWVRPTSDIYNDNTWHVFVSQYFDTNNRWFIGNFSSSLYFYWVISGVTVQVITTIQMLANNWYHIAIERYGNELIVYTNGQIQQTLDVTGKNFPQYSAPLTVGARYTGSTIDRAFDGYIDELRIMKGTAAWTDTTFTPPTTEYST
ncbi:LamG-like jellyroll fold domain-containing protein [Papillibacter cinnamivorans]|uniref:Concanavalin A-like lectin/glucanases superfamily protein n=1 Tax=Papillibacter cinnamivorans DSM 12816 TaxID=1122930 RepID=A0A1W1YTJ1_9FIRM|nr:LamG-like jellyroll fold domain-containing protein [Papillibacter cinnamivorans]SMC39433.1 Concanavalin A-like lectin/glucanases superfamily protein [Papillibacter cinnamivorans DSM 12816]